MATEPKLSVTSSEPARAFGRSLLEFPNLTQVEKDLLDHCRRGDVLRLPTQRPSRPTPDNTIRPGLIRFLLLDGDAHNPVHEKGVRVEGAWIAHESGNDLDLEAVRSAYPLLLWNCNLQGKVILSYASLPQLALNCSSYQGLKGHKYKSEGGLFLREVLSLGETHLTGAEIGGNLECGGGCFENAAGDALSFNRMTIKGDVFLDRGFTAKGETRLLGADIGGNLHCRDGCFENVGGAALSCDGATIKGDVFVDEGFTAKGETRLVGAEISGTLNCNGGRFENSGGHALIFAGAKVHGAAFLRNVASIAGVVDFSDMKCSSLVDNPAQFQGTMLLDGLTYDRFLGDETPTAETRILWLRRQWIAHLGTSFRPQPWEQVIKVLREMGYDGDARKVAIAKQQQMFRANKVGGFPVRQLHWLYGLLAGYGYRPQRTLAAMVLVWLAFGCCYWIADYRGKFGPTSPLITANAEIANVCGNAQGLRETSWTRCSAVPQEYTTFNPWLYSLDLILPLVNLQQEADWAPIVMKDNGVTTLWGGAFTRFLVWFEILFGWAASLLLVAVLSNLVKKD